MLSGKYGTWSHIVEIGKIASAIACLRCRFRVNSCQLVVLKFFFINFMPFMVKTP